MKSFCEFSFLSFHANDSRRRRSSFGLIVKSFVCLIVVFGAASLTANAKPSWAGRPDYAFGSLGKVTAHFTLIDLITDMALQPDGKIVAANVASNGSADFSAIRYNADGSIDTTFGNRGSALTDFAGSGDEAYTVAVQPDGKIILGGSATVESFRPAAVRYNSDGTLDASFGNGGKKVLQTLNGQFFTMALQPDGKILLAGFTFRVNSASSADFLVARLLSDGTLDNSFGNGGLVITDFFNSNDVVNDLIIQSDGKILVVGTDEIDAPASDFALVRYNTDGTLDVSFGDGGKVTTNFSADNDEAKAVALQADGKIVVGGVVSISSSRNSALTRYNPDGKLDTSFASGGKFITDTPFSGFFDVAVQSNNKIIAAGTFQKDFTLIRLDANGERDVTFDFDGVARTAFFDTSVIEEIILQPDGKLLAGGYTFDPITNTRGNALARYHLTSANGDLDGDNKSDLTVYRPENGTWYSSRSQLGFSAVQFGLPTDTPVSGDFEDDGKFDTAVFRNGNWYLLYSTNNTFRTVQFGQVGDVPVSADFDGDGKTDFAVYRNGVWYYMVDSNQQIFGFQFGQAGDVPVPADYDHDGKDDFAVFRNGTWYLQQSANGYAVVQFGQAGDVPAPADYDGDGKADQAVFRSGTWHLNRSRAGVTAVQFGAATDIPINGDFDGDDTADLTVFRSGVWYSLNSRRGLSVSQFGTQNDRPISAFYKP